MTENRLPVQLDIISDTICPWCYIGKKKLDTALAQLPDIPVEITWRPFQLNPDMPLDGMDRQAYLQAKFGGVEGAKQTYDNVRNAAREIGLNLQFERIKTTPNTLASHSLIRWAHSAGVQDKVVTDLFIAYFEDGKNISDHKVLSDIAEENGMDWQSVAHLLAIGSDLDKTRAEDKQAREMGVQGVPAFVFNKQYLISGAQPVETFVKMLDTLSDPANRKSGDEKTKPNR